MANVITVTALNRYVKAILEKDAVLTDIAICGEISNFTKHYKTGHLYFSLKDEQCTVKAVMFRREAQSLSFQPENGMRVILRGRVSLFERDGTFQVYADMLIPDGTGAMQIAFNQLKEKLSREGLFDAEYKKPIPAFPKKIGLVTSKTGAALQDILNVTRRRCPFAEFLLAPVTVQGIAAAPEIAQAIRKIDASGKADVIIVARGGGSQEDLFVFNSEEIARTAFACQTPLISAIGHEIDFCILDFVADLRAPTPSAAAELAVPDVQSIMRQILKNYSNICKEIQNRVQLCYNILNTYESSVQLKTAHARPEKSLQELNTLTTAVRMAVERKLSRSEMRFSADADMCDSLNPYRVLARGYSVARKNNTVIKHCNEISAGDHIELQVSDGRIGCAVETVLAEEM